jgi:hypothetical protein
MSGGWWYRVVVEGGGGGGYNNGGGDGEGTSISLEVYGSGVPVECRRLKMRMHQSVGVLMRGCLQV